MIFASSNAAATAEAAGPLIKNATMQSFNADVIAASMERPVIVDFWAPWCGPCKTLGPLLEKLVRAANGAVRMVKVNIDENQALAAELRIQSVPTVYAFVGGQVVDGFVGAQPESKLKQFIAGLSKGAGDPLADALAQGDAALADGDFKAAAKVFSAVLGQDPGSVKALAGLVRSHIGAGNVAAARRLIDGLDAKLKVNTDIAAAIVAVELAEQSRDSGDLAKLKARVAARPDDHQSRLDLAVALYGKGQTEAAIDELLAMIRIDREWNDQAARKQLVKIFDALGFSHPSAVAGRRRLSSILFS